MKRLIVGISGASGVMVVVILAFRRVAERRIRQGLRDAVQEFPGLL